MYSLLDGNKCQREERYEEKYMMFQGKGLNITKASQTMTLIKVILNKDLKEMLALASHLDNGGERQRERIRCGGRRYLWYWRERKELKGTGRFGGEKWQPMQGLGSQTWLSSESWGVAGRFQS